MKNKRMSVTAGALLLWAVGWATISAGYPRIYSPYSFPVVVPVLALSEVFRGIAAPLAFALGSLPIPLSFIAWSFHLLGGQEEIPKRSGVAALVLVFLSAVFLLAGWSYGIQYQGITHTAAMCLFNLCFWIVLFLIHWANARQCSFATNLLFHWILFAWFGWVAFPWLGELP